MSNVITREASELGWRPGYWPLAVTVDDKYFVHHHEARDNDNDIMYMEYHTGSTQHGDILRVFND